MAMKMKQTESLSINNSTDVEMAARRLTASLKLQEDNLRLHLKQLPREAVKTGIGSVMPAIVNNKLAAVAVAAGAAIVGKYVVPKMGLLTLGEIAVKYFLNKKKKARE
jgi:hypothetical protein